MAIIYRLYADMTREYLRKIMWFNLTLMKIQNIIRKINFNVRKLENETKNWKIKELIISTSGLPLCKII